MKKHILLLSVLILTIFCVSDIRAEESFVPPTDGERNMQDPGMEPKKGGKMGGGMMQHNKPSVVATSDGGVVVLDGPRLLKYDSQLTLIGEAELKPGKKGPQMKRSEAAVPSEQAPAVEEPVVELPAAEDLS